jgi:hypothetical protein
MKYKIQIISIFIITTLLSSIPSTISAFWFFNSSNTNTKTAESPIQTLTDKEKIETSLKYKLWINSFEKKDIEAVVLNYDKFTYTIPELNYILETEGKNIKNPTITNANIKNNNNILRVTADIHKIINGTFSFNANIIPVDNKIQLEISNVKLYGISIPSKWLEKPINKSFNEYFDFMYKDKRYQGFSFTNKDNTLKLKFEFKK